MDNNVIQAINRYGLNKESMDSLKKLVDADSKFIKEHVSNESVDTGDYVATVKTITSESFDNDKLVAALHKVWEGKGSMQNPYLKMVFVPDMEAIEEGIYNGELDPACLKDCKVSKSQTRLTIKKCK